METIFISFPVEDLRSMIEETVKKTLKENNQNNSPPPDNDEFLTVKQAASFLSLSVPTIYSLISRKELPVMKRAKLCYFSKADLLNYLQAGRIKSNSEIELEVKNRKKKIK